MLWNSILASSTAGISCTISGMTDGKVFVFQGESADSCAITVMIFEVTVMIFEVSIGYVPDVDAGAEPRLPCLVQQVHGHSGNVQDRLECAVRASLCPDDCLRHGSPCTNQLCFCLLGA